MPALVPGDWQGVERLLRLPVGVGDHSNGIGWQRDHPVHPLTALHGFLIIALEPPPEHRTLSDGRVEHLRHADVCAEDRLAQDLVQGVKTFDGRAQELPLRRRLERDVLGGTSARAAASATFPKVRVRPDGVCVITLCAAAHSVAGTPQRAAAAAMSISRRWPLPGADTHGIRARSGCRR